MSKATIRKDRDTANLICEKVAGGGYWVDEIVAALQAVRKEESAMIIECISNFQWAYSVPGHYRDDLVESLQRIRNE